MANNRTDVRPIRVLIVEDEALVRWAVVHTLSAHGCTVLEAADAASMMQLLSADGAFDVVLLDYRLPDSQDLTPLTTVRRIAPASRVIMLSAHMAPEVADEARRLGAHAVLSKPFDLDDLCALILEAQGEIS